MTPLPLTTSEAYDLWAASYDGHDNPLVAQSELVLDELAPLLAGRAVLELGCGTGRLAPRVLAAGAASYTGVDGSAGMLARASALAAAADTGARARWVHAAVEELPADLAGFDVVLFCLVLEHARELGPPCAAAARALAPGGLLVAIELHAELAERGVGAHFEHAGQTIRLASFAHSAAELRAACAAAGLVTERATDWFPDARSISRSHKLARYTGTPVLLELRARRPST